jgi:hypothetical protein
LSSWHQQLNSSCFVPLMAEEPSTSSNLGVFV